MALINVSMLGVDNRAIRTMADPAFLSFWRIYKDSFPLGEIRTEEDQQRIFLNKAYCLEVWIKEEQLIGFIGWWDCGNFRYVEHFAIDEVFRSAGYGNTILSEWMSRSETPVILEIEPIIDEITHRRRNFYLQLGFKENDMYHWHPPYQRNVNMNNVELRILSYPQEITAQTYQAFLKMQRAEIIPVFS